jgi:hypothetical protein
MLALHTKLVTLLFFFLFGVAEIKHPLHVSNTEINYNQKDKTLEISCKVFTDDFESVLSKNFKQKIDLTNPKMKESMDILVKKYISTHLNVKADNKNCSLNYIGFEIDHEATNIYFEVEKVNSPKSLEVNCSILYDLFDDQMSIFHLVNNGTRKSGRILYPEKTFKANF